MSAVVSFEAMSRSPAAATLAQLRKGESARVIGIRSSNVALAGIERRLAELGFLPGENVRVVARGVLGGDPIAVRVGTSTFALRGFEAECIQVAVASPR
jgi:ferrous iron transport protein A